MVDRENEGQAHPKLGGGWQTLTTVSFRIPELPILLFEGWKTIQKDGSSPP